MTNDRRDFTYELTATRATVTIWTEDAGVYQADFETSEATPLLSELHASAKMIEGKSGNGQATRVHGEMSGTVKLSGRIEKFRKTAGGVRFWVHISDHVDSLDIVRSKTAGWTVLRELYLPACGLSPASWLIEIEDVNTSAPADGEGKVIWPVWTLHADGSASVSHYGVPSAETVPE